MEINSDYILHCLLTMMYNDIDNDLITTIYQQKIINVSFETVNKYLIDRVSLVGTVKGHVQYQIIKDMCAFVNEKNKEPREPAYYLCMFIYFITSIPCIHDGGAFIVVYPNAVMEYAWLNITGDGNVITMYKNSFANKCLSFKVLFNNKLKLLFDLETHETFVTKYGDFIEIDGNNFTVSKPFKYQDCVIILSEGPKYKVKNMWFNDAYDKKLQKISYFYK